MKNMHILRESSFVRHLPIAILVAGFSFCVEGCSAVQYHTTIANLKTKCDQDGLAKWLLPPPRIDELLVVSNAQNPQNSNGVVDPNLSAGTVYGISEARILLRILPINKIYVYVSDDGRVARTLFGNNPQTGIYAVELWPKNSTNCKNIPHLLENPNAPISGVPPRKNQDDTCLTWRYIGKVPISNYKYVYIGQYLRNSPLKQGEVFENAEELRGMDGIVYARAVNYSVSFGYEASGSACKPYNIYALLLDTYAAGQK